MILLASFSPRSLLPSTIQTLKSALLSAEYGGLVARSDHRGGYLCRVLENRARGKKRIQQKLERMGKACQNKLGGKHLRNRRVFLVFKVFKDRFTV